MTGKLGQNVDVGLLEVGIITQGLGPETPNYGEQAATPASHWKCVGGMGEDEGWQQSLRIQQGGDSGKDPKRGKRAAANTSVPEKHQHLEAGVGSKGRKREWVHHARVPTGDTSVTPKDTVETHRRVLRGPPQYH